VKTTRRTGFQKIDVKRTEVPAKVQKVEVEGTPAAKVDQLVEGDGRGVDRPQGKVAQGGRAPWMTRLSASEPGESGPANAGHAPERIGNAPAPESVKGEVKAAWSALAQIPGLDLGGAKVSTLEGGATNALFLVDLPSEDAKYVLRLAGEGNDHINRAADVEGTERAEQLGIGPKVRFVDERQETILTEYVEAKAISKDALDDARFSQVADVLQTIHGAPPSCNGKTFDPFVRIEEAADALRARGPLSPEVEQALSFVGELDSGLRPFIDGSTTPCHNDTNPGNLLLGEGKVWAIDWDYAGNGDPMYDLGTMAACLQLDDDQSKTLLAKYRGVDEKDVSKADVAHLEMSRLTNTLWASLWFFAKSEKSGDLNQQIGQANLDDFAQRIEGFGQQ
jgi:thiamine kinase-like enzyme